MSDAPPAAEPAIEQTVEPAVEIRVEASEAGKRLDRILSDRELGHSRATLQRWIDEERVRVDGEPAKRKVRPPFGALIEVWPAPPPLSAAQPQAMDLDVVFEDEHLLVIDKPSGLVVHPGAGHPDGTLVNGLLHHTMLADGGDPVRPGIVHRLDKDTSGVMVVAKQPPARDGLVELFQAHDIERAYVAIAVGHPPEQITHETLHGRHPHDRKRFSSRVERGKRAVTHMVVEQRLHAASLVRCTLETGRTHQIRVHLADTGHPVLGDVLYGSTPRDPRLSAALAQLGRLALHARVLGFVHPVTGEALRFERPPPAPFLAAVDALAVDQAPPPR